MSMKIAICDDDQKNCQQVKNYLLKFCEKEQMDAVQICMYYSPLELLEQYPENLDLLIMDIEMPGMNGIQTAKQIRKFDQQVTLIYMTNYAQYAIEGYSVQAYNYLLKPITYETLSREVAGIFPMIIAKKEQRISLNCREGYRVVSINEIIMLETQGKNVILHTAEEQLLVYRSMKYMEEQLAETMFRIHTAYMVSFHAIKQVHSDSILLKNGLELPVSRHRKKEFMNRYMKYIGGLL